VYTVEDLQAATLPAGNPFDPERESKVSKGVGKVTTHFKVEDKGTEKIANLDARHWIVDSKMSGSGCIGTFNVDSKREFWTASLPTFSCPKLDSWTIPSSQTVNECQVTNETTGDVTAFYDSMKGVIVKEITYNAGKPAMTRELVDYSTAELDDSLFSLEGYRKVDKGEFERLRQESMMKLMQR
jgi:hypothetical protein